MIEVKITGVEELRRDLRQFSDRRFNATVATALTRTAKALSQGWQQQIDAKIDRPTARTQAATSFKGASASQLTATVLVKQRMPGMAPAAYLAHHETGSARLIKKFEQALINSGAMPRGFVTVPGRHAKLDAFGNVSRAQIVAVIAQLGSDYSPGYQRVISKSVQKRLARQRRHGRTYIAVSPAEARKLRVSPGIYERMPDESRKAVFLFRSSTRYSKRLDLVGRAKLDVGKVFGQEFGRAAAESLARMQARAGR